MGGAFQPGRPPDYHRPHTLGDTFTLSIAACRNVVTPGPLPVLLSLLVVSAQSSGAEPPVAYSGYTDLAMREEVYDLGNRRRRRGH